MKSASLAMVVTLVFLSGCAKETAVPTIEPIATVLELHETMISPASDVIFNVGSDPPNDEASWKSVRSNALILAESGNLLMMEGRAKDNGAWVEMSKSMVDGAVLAKRAAEAKDAEAVSKASDQIVAACMRCHEPYRDHHPMIGR